MNSLSIQDSEAITVLNLYSQFKKEYDEMVFQCKKFVTDELDKIINADTEENKTLACVAFKHNIFPPENYCEETKTLITKFLLVNGAPGAIKKLDYTRLFYLYKLLILNGTIAADKTAVEAINFIFDNYNFDIHDDYVEFTRLNDTIPTLLNSYEYLFNRFKEITDNVDINIEIKDDLVDALIKLSIIRIIVDNKAFEKEV